MTKRNFHLLYQIKKLNDHIKQIKENNWHARGRHDATLPSWVNSVAYLQEEKSELLKPATKIISTTAHKSNYINVNMVAKPPVRSVIPTPDQKGNSRKVSWIAKSSSTTARSPRLERRAPESTEFEEIQENIQTLHVKLNRVLCHIEGVEAIVE